MSEMSEIYDIVSGEIKEIPQDEIEEETKREYDSAKKEADQKISKLMVFLGSNSAWKTRKIVAKFGLDWSLIRDFGNGISEVGFYTDESQRFLAMTLHLPTDEWFR